MTNSSYEVAEARYKRWLDDYRHDREAHAKARNAHPDPAALDAEFSQAYRVLSGPSRRPSPEVDALVKAGTDLLQRGASADPRYFKNYELSGPNLGDIVDLLESGKIDPPLAGFLKALTACEASAVLNNRRYCGNGGQELPYFVLRAVITGEPWGSRLIAVAQSGSWREENRTFRRACLRVLARMAFWSAECACAQGAPHPFVVLLNTDRGGIHLMEAFQIRHLSSEAINRGCMLQVLYLMIFVYRRFPWPRRQYLADIEYANSLHASSSAWEGYSMRTNLARRIMRIILFMPAFLHALVEQKLWHVLVAYRVDKCDTYRCSIHHGRRRDRFCVWGDHLSSRQHERNLMQVLSNDRLISIWFCGKEGRCFLLELCRQRRRRVVQVSHPTVGRDPG